MNHFALRAISILFALVFSGAANAQLFRAYLSSTGSDQNPCTLHAPCRLLPAALAAVAPKGEIWMLDSANYNKGMVQINKSVTVLAIPGEVGSVVAQGNSSAIAVQTAGVDVKLRNLAIVNNATNPGSQGIFIDAIATLTVEGCVIAGMPFAGIRVANAATVSISDSVIRNSAHGIDAGNGASVDVSHVKFSGMDSHGVVGYGSLAGTRVTISDSDFTDSEIGISARTIATGSTVRIAVMRSSVTAGNFGVSSQVDVANGVASVSVADSTLAGLNVAFRQSGSGAVTESFGNNTVRNNSANQSGTLTTVPSM